MPNDSLHYIKNKNSKGSFTILDISKVTIIKSI